MKDLSRRGLLSLMAAAPVAALAKPAPLYASGGFIAGADMSSIARIGESCGETIMPLRSGWGIVDYAHDRLAAPARLEITNPPDRDPAAEPGGAFSPLISHERLRVPSGSDTQSPEDVERFMKLARAM